MRETTEEEVDNSGKPRAVHDIINYVYYYMCMHVCTAIPFFLFHSHNVLVPDSRKISLYCLTCRHVWVVQYTLLIDPAAKDVYSDFGGLKH